MMLEKFRFWLIDFLWKFEHIRRNYCWADAVVWAYGLGKEIRKADHKCFYCLACNTEEEIDRHFLTVTIENKGVENASDDNAQSQTVSHG